MERCHFSKRQRSSFLGIRCSKKSVLATGDGTMSHELAHIAHVTTPLVCSRHQLAIANMALW
jgi:hypothetical protein